MQSQTLEKNLQKLDFKTDSPAYGLLFTDKDYKDNPKVSFDQILILSRAHELKATAVYFRLIEGRNPVPQIFIYDNSDNSISQDDLNDIHKKLWSSGIVPLYYVFDKTELKIFNCRKPLQKTLRTDPFVTLKLTSMAFDEYKKRSEYSAKLFENGSFWEIEENRNRFKADNSSNNKLISELKIIQKKLIKDQNADICNKLLVLSILVKYLEERKDRTGKPAALKPEYFRKYDKAESFCDVLRKNKCTDLFADLSKEVNGKIFTLNENEKIEFHKLDQSKLSVFLDAKLEDQQHVFWKLYDFNYIPVELISRIYEEFIPKRRDITHTPVHLVSFMVDECMPINKPQNDFKLIDVSCGSGIFLVAAFKRIVQWWQKEQFEKTDKIKPPTLTKLKSILTNSIYGVDLERESVRLATFSLTLALLDMLDPTKMWDELTKEKLVDLNNIIEKDFFDFKNDKKFDLVIGNPPFNLPVEKKDETSKKKLKKEYWENLLKKVEMDFDIPQKNIALLFLQQSIKLLKKDGLLSLVMPSGALLYNDTLEFRKNLLSTYNVPQIFDFSSLNTILFPNRNVAVSVVFVQNKKPDEKDILHVVIKRTITTKEKFYFEIDRYDLFYVPKEIAKTDQLIWKTNLLGSGRLYHLIRRLRSLRSLREYLERKKKKYGWFFAEGYKPLGESTEEPQEASWLTNKDWIPTEKFTKDYINNADIDIEKACSFDRNRQEDQLIFKGPHVLIREMPTLPIAFCENDLIFRREIIGIYAPDKNELIKIRKDIIANKELYKMFLLATSGKAGVNRSVSTIYMKDIMSLPYPDNIEDLKLSKAEQIVCDDVLYYGIEQLSKGEEAKVNTKTTNKKIMSEFAEVFCTSLNSIYEEGSKRFYSLEYIESLTFICQPFVYGNPDKPKKISDSTKKQIENGNLESLIDNPHGTNVLYKRVIKLYPQKDMIYLIKPKTLRYWLKSIALRDASEVFSDLVRSGY
jgi:hypothetical protein